MTGNLKLEKPWLVAVWPGMGSVALTAGYYLMAKLGMTAIGEYSPNSLFDVDHVDISEGLIRTAPRPRSRLFAWRDPQHRHDVVVLIGEAQPEFGKYRFCQELIEHANDLGVQHVFTFAAMATQMHPEHDPRVFGAANDGEGLRELQRLNLELLKDGRISGLNGLLLGAAAEAGIRGTCLLGEIPHVLAQIPFPRASMVVLEAFARIASIELDFTELAEQAELMQQKIGNIVSRVEDLMQREEPPEEAVAHEAEQEPRLSLADERQIEELFAAAIVDRSRAYLLKQRLDELGVFRNYEDRFLDLFRTNG